MSFIKEKTKKILNYISLLFISVLSLVNKVKADAGFHGSYGGGSSHSSHSSHSSRSSSYSSSSSSSSSHSSATKKEVLYMFAAIFLVGILYYIIYKLILKRLSLLYKVLITVIYFAITIVIASVLLNPIVGFTMVTLLIPWAFSITLASVLKNNLPSSRIIHNYFSPNQYDQQNTKELQEELFNIYKDVQIAWSNNDMEPVRSVLTDELFNSFTFQLESLIVNKQRNVMEDIVFDKMSIRFIGTVNDIEQLKVVMEVHTKDYIVQTKGKKEVVVRGNKNLINDYIYELTFVKNRVRKLNYCPNCGNKISKGMSEKCKYCDAILVHETNTYVLSKIQMLSQKVYKK